MRPAAVLALLVAALVAAAPSGAHRERAACRPALLTQAQVAKALGRPVPQIELSPLPMTALPPVAGRDDKARGYECDWGLTTNGHIGLDDGRASLFVFTTPAAARGWFTAYTAHETPPCRTKPFADAACNEVGSFPGGVYPLFQALQGRYVVWIHLIQKRTSLGPLEELATDILGRAPQVG